MQKLEYRAVEVVGSGLTKLEVQSIDDEWIPFQQRTLFIEYLKELGKEGWELAGTRVGIYIFKRPIEE